MTVLGRLTLKGPGGEAVDWKRLLASHGVATLAPNRVDEAAGVLETTVALDASSHTIRISEEVPGGALVESLAPVRGQRAHARLLALARHVLRLDEDLSPFYKLAARDRSLRWVTAGSGRMLRNATVYEDVVKTICTTNCSWSATIRMTSALVEHLGTAAADGRRAFPGPAAMADAPESFYADVGRCGYRGPYLRRLAADVASGDLDLEQLLDPEIADEEVERRLLALPGVGPYAAAHVMLISLGRYRRLILDSWTRPTYAKIAGEEVDDKEIVRRFGKFGPYAGLAFWMVLTRDWVDD